MIKNILKILLASALILALFGSCVSKKELSYFYDDETIDYPLTLQNKLAERMIKPYDIIRIQILSIDRETAELFNVENRGMQSEALINLSAYQVDEDGRINFPFIGQIELEGKNLEEAKKIMEDNLSDYLSNSSIKIDFVNNKISVLGEVRAPGTDYYYDKRITIFEAIAGAGGISEYGKKDDIILIRTQNDEILTKQIDLTSHSILSSEFYYLQSGDVLIVRPIDTRYSRLNDYSRIGIIFSSISTLVTVVSLALTIQRL
jgi:polysaccharide export outer membrane protein